MALIGALVVLMVGLLGRRLGGGRVGLIAALIAAVYPNMWIPDALLFPEPIARLCVLAALLLALRCRVRPSTLVLLGLGAACGLAALARSELLLLLPLLAIPQAWRLRRAGWRILYEPAARVAHEQGRSTSRSPYRMLVAHHRSILRFANRSTEGRERLLLPFVALALGARLVLSASEHYAATLSPRPWRPGRAARTAAP